MIGGFHGSDPLGVSDTVIPLRIVELHSKLESTLQFLLKRVRGTESGMQE